MLLEEYTAGCHLAIPFLSPKDVAFVPYREHGKRHHPKARSNYHTPNQLSVPSSWIPHLQK